MPVDYKEESIPTFEEFEELEQTVLAHEDLLADLITALSNETSLSESTQSSITKIYKQLYGTK